MDSILRGAITYLFVWIVFRLAGKRSLAQITTFDAVLLLIISETTQTALIDNDHSMTNAGLLIITLVGLDIFLSWVKQHFPLVERVMDGIPLLLVENGVCRKNALEKERVTEEDILHAARQLRGIEALEDIRHAVLEQSGGITIISKPGKAHG
jgi:uncharacterized membrane protein YcaP (DUF421 family)